MKKFKIGDIVSVKLFDQNTNESVMEIEAIQNLENKLTCNRDSIPMIVEVDNLPAITVYISKEEYQKIIKHIS